MAAICADGRWRGAVPAAKVSTTIMRPPQQGQRCVGVGAVSPASSLLSVRFVAAASAVAASSSWRARAMHVAALAVGEQAVVADAVEARGQHVQQEAADELGTRERHRLAAARGRRRGSPSSGSVTPSSSQAISRLLEMATRWV